MQEVGTEVKKWKIGERVTIDLALPCGKFYYCKKGETNINV
ncbi:MAG: alcohol dehydrogenase catalytic domain-containing protein [Promethearchaeota archaeon]